MRILKWTGIAFVSAILLGVVGCSTVGLPNVSATPETTPARPNLLAPIGGMDQVRDVENWESERAPFWTNMLLSQVYGSIPPATEPRILSSERTASGLLGGKADLYAVQLELTISGRAFRQDVHFVVPNTLGPHPVILGAGSCPNHKTLPDFPVEIPDNTAYPGYCDTEGFTHSVSMFVFGRYIETPPLEDLIDHGFAFGAYYPGMVVPDSSVPALEILEDIRVDDGDHGPYAAIGVWAWVASRIMDYVETDPHLDESRVILFGHSRTGKSSLLGGALDPRIAGVIAHQSGTAGAAIQKNGVGETIASITETFPHWFTPTYALYADREEDLPFDQHALVALMAPRPLLLGNSARDQWSDPRGSFTAARAAGEVYALDGKPGFEVRNLRGFDLEADLAFQFRGGTHGIVPEDWNPFLEWLDAHFGDN